MIDINSAISFAREKHRGQKRKNGEDYISHPLTVALMLSTAGYDENTVAAGLFHDLLEDTDATEDEIFALTNSDVLEAVKLVTKSGDVDEEEYIRRILENPIAKAVKNADRIHNLTDSVNGTPEFAKRYAKDTEEHYLHRFSGELDEKYSELCAKFGLDKR